MMSTVSGSMNLSSVSSSASSSSDLPLADHPDSIYSTALSSSISVNSARDPRSSAASSIMTDNESGHVGDCTRGRSQCHDSINAAAAAAEDSLALVGSDPNSMAAGSTSQEFIKYVGKGSYKCVICDIYSKNNKDYIQDHINIKHYNIKKNYQCLLCNITFAWRSGAFKHLKKYHNIEGKNTINHSRAISRRHLYNSQRKRK